MAPYLHSWEIATDLKHAPGALRFGLERANAGCPAMLRHDFRRTAVRNAVNAGVPEKVATQMTGHKTRSVFDRYHVVSPGDLQEAARKISQIPGCQCLTRRRGTGTMRRLFSACLVTC